MFDLLSWRWRENANGLKFARPLAFGRVRSLKIALFPFPSSQLSLSPIAFKPFSLVPCFLYLVSGRARGRPGAQSPLNHTSAEVPGNGRRLLAAPWANFSRFLGLKASKIHDIFASLQKPPKTIIWSPKSAPGRFLDKCSSILGAILASIFRLSRASVLYRTFIVFYRFSRHLNLAKIDFRS